MIEDAADRAAFFADDGIAALYAPPAGAPAAVTVLLEKPDTGGRAFSSELRLAPAAADIAWRAILRRDEVADPVRGATLIFAPRAGDPVLSYPVRDVRPAPSDPSGEFWLLELGKPV